jgi:hypothetical protein
MRIKNFGNTSVAGVDFAASGRQAALLAMPRVEVRPVAAVTSGWNTDVAGSDSRSVHAWRDGKGDLRATWQNLDSRLYCHRCLGSRAGNVLFLSHHALMLSWLSYVVSVSKRPVTYNSTA